MEYFKNANCDKCFRNAYRMVFLFVNSQNLQVLGFFWEKLNFFRKRGFKGTEREKKFRKRLKLFYCLNILETFQMLVFLGKKEFFRSRALKCFKTAKREKIFSKASQMVLLLKKFENPQILGFFCE